MSLREELWKCWAFWAGPRMGASVSAQDLVGVLHDGPVENKAPEAQPQYRLARAGLPFMLRREPG